MCVCIFFPSWCESTWKCLTVDEWMGSRRKLVLLLLLLLFFPFLVLSMPIDFGLRGQMEDIKGRNVTLIEAISRKDGGLKWQRRRRRRKLLMNVEPADDNESCSHRSFRLKRNFKISAHFHDDNPFTISFFLSLSPSRTRAEAARH